MGIGCSKSHVRSLTARIAADEVTRPLQVGLFVGGAIVSFAGAPCPLAPTGHEDAIAMNRCYCPLSAQRECLPSPVPIVSQ